MTQFRCPEIPREWVQVSTSRASGPGGQGVNKSESKVEVKLNLAQASWIPWDVKDLLFRKLASQLTEEGEIRVVSQASRSQSENLQNCLERLREIIRAALFVPKARKATKPSRSSQKKRLESKRKHSLTKKMRSQKSYE